MSVFTISKTMLYCPKCKATYEEGKQRFCSNDDTRLLLAGVTPATQQKSVFAHLLKTKNPNFFENGESKANATSDRNSEPFKVFQQPLTADSFQSKKEIKTGLNDSISIPSGNTDKPNVFTEAPKAAKPSPRLIKPNEVKISQAKLGDRSANPTGRLPLTWENTAVLLGQTIKGRYFIVEQLGEDETSVAYLAEDKIMSGKKIVVRVLMEENSADDFEKKIFAEERVSLSHINHPHIAHLIDSGRLLEGKEFIVSEYVKGISLKEKLRTVKQFDAKQVARIVRQAADALGEAHQNGVLHRNLKPENIVIASLPTGEQVKVTDFAVFDGLDQPTEETLKYLSPEQLEGRVPNFASDIYSLAVIAYQMLTGRFPFNFESEKEILKAQKQGLQLHPTNLRLELSTQVDEVLEKALAYKSSERYPKARDFGDAMYNALTTTSSLSASYSKPFVQKDTTVFEPIPFVEEKPTEPKIEKKEIFEPKTESAKTPTIEESKLDNPEIVRGKVLPLTEIPDVEIEWVESDDLETEDNSDAIDGKSNLYIEAKPEKALGMEDEDVELEEEKPQALPVKSKTSSSINGWAIGAILLGLAILAMLFYGLSRFNQTPTTSKPQTANIVTEEIKSSVQPVQPVAPAEIQPQKRQIVQPPNTVLFENSRENLTGETAKNFRGFSFYYPNDWTKNSAAGMNFVDVARFGETGTPIEQFLVSYYESTGIFDTDQGIFKQLVEKSKVDLEKALNGKFQALSEGETRINGDWRAYELKFQGEGVTKNGDKVTLWGRRLWLPAGKAGVKTGFILTLVATSISPEVKSVNDIGVKGELAQVLSTFEPASLETKQ